jgi:hypothetical protein
MFFHSEFNNCLCVDCDPFDCVRFGRNGLKSRGYMSMYTGRHMGHGELFRGGNYYFEGPLNHGELFRGGELKREIR